MRKPGEDLLVARVVAQVERHVVHAVDRIADVAPRVGSNGAAERDQKAVRVERLPRMGGPDQGRPRRRESLGLGKGQAAALELLAHVEDSWVRLSLRAYGLHAILVCSAFDAGEVDPEL